MHAMHMDLSGPFLFRRRLVADEKTFRALGALLDMVDERGTLADDLQPLKKLLDTAFLCERKASE